MKRLGVDHLGTQTVRTLFTQEALRTHLVDTAHTETERATFNTGAVHVISDEKDKLHATCQWNDRTCSIGLTLRSSLKYLASSSDFPASDNLRALWSGMLGLIVVAYAVRGTYVI